MLPYCTLTSLDIHLSHATMVDPFHITADEINCLIYAYFKDSGAWDNASFICIFKIIYLQVSNTAHLFYVRKVVWSIRLITGNMYLAENWSSC